MDGSRIFLEKELAAAGGVPGRQAGVTAGKQLKTAVFAALVDREERGKQHSILVLESVFVAAL